MRQILCGILLLIVMSVRGDEVLNVILFSPVIYESVLEAAAKDKKISSTYNENPSYSLPGKIYFSELLMSDEEKKDYDQAFSLLFSFAPDIKYNIYAKDNFIKKLIRINIKNNQQSIYVRKGQAKELEKFSKDYQELSHRVLSDVYAHEDMFPAFRKQHPNENVIDFEVIRYTNIGGGGTIWVKYPCISTIKHMNLLNNTFWNGGCIVGDSKSFITRFAFSIVHGVDYIPDSHDYISESGIENNSGDTGFFCHFFPSEGLQDYVTKTSGKWGLQTVWNENGIQTGTYAFPPGFVRPKPSPKEIPTEYDPADTWFNGLQSLKSCSGVYADYWDAATKSPCYKFVMDMNEDKLFAEFMFARKTAQIDSLYEKMYKEAQVDATSKNLKVESPVVSIERMPIGKKSFSYPEGEIIFLRDNMVVKLRSLKKTKDIRSFALEFDKAWLSWHAQRKREAEEAESLAKARKTHIEINSAIFKTKYAKEYDEIKQVSDPVKSKELMDKLKQRVLADYKAENEKVHDLVNEYQKTQDPKLREQLKTIATEKYDRKIELYKKIVSTLEQNTKDLQTEIENFKESLKKRIEEKDQVINKEIDTICKNTDFIWPLEL